MKLTKSHLRSIIKEELEKVDIYLIFIDGAPPGQNVLREKKKLHGGKENEIN